MESMRLMGVAYKSAVLALLVGCGGNTVTEFTTTTTSAGSGGNAATATGAGPTSGSGAGSATTTTGGNSSSSGSGMQPVPEPQFVPSGSGACPDITSGDVTFSPKGIAARKVKVWVSDDPTSQDGPLVFYWHGAGSQPNEANYGLGAETIKDVLARGGMVVSPYHDPKAGQFPWFLTTGAGAEDDLLVADEVVACAIEKVGIDIRHIHSVGMSAGGLQTTQFSYRRSGYLASVAPYSGGKLGSPPQQEQQNKFAAMIIHGGPSDQVIVNFETLSEGYLADLQQKGHFAFICNHGKGHIIPTDARASLWQFLLDHPYGVAPSPYEGGLPGSFPSYCGL